MNYLTQKEAELISRIQAYMDEEVVAARPLYPRYDASIPASEVTSDDMIYPFVYRTANLLGEYRGAFTNDEPMWEEEDPDAFARVLGEIKD